jgi:hypothetical protein
MKPASVEVRLNGRDAALAILAVACAGVFQLLLYVAPAFLSRPLWDGSALTAAFLCGALSVAIPVVIAWWIIRADKTAAAGSDR